jgi:ABC-type transporter Mla subunit MlaD
VHTITRKERVQALVFLVVGAAIIVGVCGFLIGIPLLKDTTHYYVRFHESIAGIDEGSDVRYRGVKSGRVRNISIDYDEILIELQVDPSLRVTETTQARISVEGLLGPYFVELYGTTPDSPELPEGAFIKTDPSTMKTLVDKGTQTFDNLEAVLKSLQRWASPENEARFTKLLDSASSALATIDNTVKSVQPDAERLVKNYADASAELTTLLSENREALRAMLDEVRKTAAELRRFLESGKLDEVAAQAGQTFESVRADFHEASTSFSRALDEARLGERFDRVVASLERTEKNLAEVTAILQAEVLTVARGELAPALGSFRDAMATLNELVRSLRDDPSRILFSRPRQEIQIPRPGPR